LVAGLSRGSLWRMVVEGETIKNAEELFVDDHVRLRKVVQSQMGKLYILTDEMNRKLIWVRSK
jgi:aldose sugar dehydrogenase